MKRYIGTKELTAKPLTLGKYNVLRGWTIPKDEDPETQGYLVQYLDGYESWSPKNQFEEAYRSDGYFNFGHALFLLNQGYRVSRRGWNGKNMYLFRVEADRMHQAYIAMVTVEETIVPWLCSQTDMLTSDWTCHA